MIEDQHPEIFLPHKDVKPNARPSNNVELFFYLCNFIIFFHRYSIINKDLNLFPRLKNLKVLANLHQYLHWNFFHLYWVGSGS